VSSSWLHPPSLYQPHREKRVQERGKAGSYNCGLVYLEEVGTEMEPMPTTTKGSCILYWFFFPEGINSWSVSDYFHHISILIDWSEVAKKRFIMWPHFCWFVKRIYAEKSPVTDPIFFKSFLAALVDLSTQWDICWKYLNLPIAKGKSCGSEVNIANTDRGKVLGRGGLAQGFSLCIYLLPQPLWMTVCNTFLVLFLFSW
jgi:hypothetical protein